MVKHSLFSLILEFLNFLKIFCKEIYKNQAKWPRFLFHCTPTGQWFDKEMGLFENIFRYYNANVRRQTQSEPLGLEAE